jgi:hypothetical protein
VRPGIRGSRDRQGFARERDGIARASVRRIEAGKRIESLDAQAIVSGELGSIARGLELGVGELQAGRPESLRLRSCVEVQHRARLHVGDARDARGGLREKVESLLLRREAGQVEIGDEPDALVAGREGLGLAQQVRGLLRIS